MAETDVKRHSVTKNDVGTVGGASIFHFMLNCQTSTTGLPAWWSPSRDWVLRSVLYTPFRELWTSAISIAITKMASQAWELESDAPRLRNQFQELLLAADNNQSWVSFLSRHLQDFLCTDNGAFVEIVRATSAAGSRILGLMHLDSLRCTRTGDPDIPVVYRDTKGQEHQMRAHQVIVFSDMPSSSETWFGVGLCATSRAWGTILKMGAIESYIYEKVSGERELALDLVSGLSHKQLEDAVISAKEAKAGKGYVSYMGAIVIPTMGDTPLTHERINFAELPDGFDREKEWNIGILQMANAIGLDPQDLQPLTGAALGTGAQAQVLAEKGKGKGLSAWRQQFTHNTNQFILPDTVTFAFSELDLRDEQQKATVTSTRADWINKYITSGVITAAQGAQIAADAKDIPEEFVPVDQTPGGTLTDSEKPESEREEEQARQEQQANAGEEPPTEEEETKEFTQQFKSISELASGYKAELSRLVTKTAGGRMSASDMARTHRALIAGLGQAAFAEGLKAGGVDAEEMDESDQAQVDNWVTTQAGYADDFAQAAANNQNVEGRIDLWVRSMEAIGNLGRMSAEGNRMGVWKMALGVEDHCGTCMQLHNVRHRLKWFTSKGYIPRQPGSETLECKGFRCGCKILSDDGEQLL